MAHEGRVRQGDPFFNRVRVNGGVPVHADAGRGRVKGGMVGMGGSQVEEDCKALKALPEILECFSREQTKGCRGTPLGGGCGTVAGPHLNPGVVREVVQPLGGGPRPARHVPRKGNDVEAG